MLLQEETQTKLLFSPFSGDCSTKTCDHGATCKVVLGVAKCECDFTCTDTRTPVCGTDLKTYDNECKMRETGCLAKKDITVLVADSCGLFARLVISFLSVQTSLFWFPQGGVRIFSC